MATKSVLSIRKCIFSSSKLLKSSKIIKPFEYNNKIIKTTIHQSNILLPIIYSQNNIKNNNVFFSSLSSNNKLRETISNEIEHETSSYQPPPLLQKYLQSSGFSLEEKENDVNMQLTKKTSDGKKVTVEFQLVSPFQPEGEDEDGMMEKDNNNNSNTNNNNNNNGGEMTDFSVTVEDIKNNNGGKGLTFFCTTLQNDDKFRFVVGNIRYFNNLEEKNSAFGFNGPEFEDLDDVFQEGLDEWLGEIGVDSSLCDFIDAAAIDKEHREYIRWLKNVKSFISDKKN